MDHQESVEMDISSKHAVEFMRGLGVYKDNPAFCDVTVVIDDHEFKCHRIVLATASEYFRALLSSRMKEDLNRKVHLMGITSHTFTEILECVYKAKNIVTEKNVFDIWHAANQLQISLFVKDCEIFIKSFLSPKNCFAIYQTSKLLFWPEITKLSWTLILHEFDSLRNCAEILQLTAREMKELVSSPELVTISEDRVVETILRWTAHKPKENILYQRTESNTENKCAASNEISSREANVTDLPRQENFRQTQTEDFPGTTEDFPGTTEDFPGTTEDFPGTTEDFPGTTEDFPGTTRKETEQKRQQNTTQRSHDTESFSDRDEKSRVLTDNVPNRADYLTELLEVSRICLLSGKFLMKTLWANPTIQSNPQALDIVQNAIDYQMKGDRRHDFCPLSAVHRSSSKMENVIVAINTKNTSDILVCREQNGQWSFIQKHERALVTASSAVCFQNNVYIGSDHGNISIYIASLNQWRDLPALSFPEKVLELLTLGNLLYAVYKYNDSYYIEMINICDTIDGRGQGRWTKAGTLCTTEISISCTTIVDDKIVFFGHNDANDYVIVELFDTITMSSLRLNDIAGPSTGMVSFKNQTDAFILQKNGTLWRIRSCFTAPFVEIKYETLLWDFYRVLTGAVLFRDELLLFGTCISSNYKGLQWELAVSGVFKRIRFIPCNSDYKCFTHTVLPKMVLTTKTGVQGSVSFAKCANVGGDNLPASATPFGGASSPAFGGFTFGSSSAGFARGGYSPAATRAKKPITKKSISGK